MPSRNYGRDPCAAVGETEISLPPNLPYAAVVWSRFATPKPFSPPPPPSPTPARTIIDARSVISRSVDYGRWRIVARRSVDNARLGSIAVGVTGLRPVAPRVTGLRPVAP